MRRQEFGSRLGTNPMGEHCKVGKGGASNGPAILSRAISFASFSCTIFGLTAAEERQSV